MSAYRIAQRGPTDWTVEKHVRYWVFWRRWVDVFNFGMIGMIGYRVSWKTREGAQDAMERQPGYVWPDAKVIPFPVRRAG